MSTSGTPNHVTPSIAYAMLVTIMVLWAGGVIVARSVHELVPPIGFSFWRWFTAALLLTPFAGAQLLRDRLYIKRHFRHFALLGLFMAGASTILVWALQYTTATNVTLMTATQPIATAIVAWLFLRERLAPAQLVGVSAAMSGIVIMVTRMDVAVIIGLSFNPGDVLVMVAVVFYACYSVNLHRWVSDITPLVMMYMTCLGVTIILIPAYLIESLSIRTMPPDPRVIGAVLFMALVPTLIATTMWNMSVGAIGANRASAFINLLPIFGTALAVLLLGEQFYSYHLIGGGLVCAGITLVVRSMNPDELEPRE